MAELKTFTVAEIVKRERKGVEVRTFDALDTKGRTFGAKAYKIDFTFADKEVELWDFPTNIRNTNENRRPAGLYYGYCPQAMRGGENFGACQNSQLFTNEADRDAAIEKYFANAEKRALNNKARAS